MSRISKIDRETRQKLIARYGGQPRSAIKAQAYDDARRLALKHVQPQLSDQQYFRLIRETSPRQMQRNATPAKRLARVLRVAR